MNKNLLKKHSNPRRRGQSAKSGFLFYQSWTLESVAGLGDMLTGICGINLGGVIWLRG
jgi:hypothetical protein